MARVLLAFFSSCPCRVGKIRELRSAHVIRLTDTNEWNTAGRMGRMSLRENTGLMNDHLSCKRTYEVLSTLQKIFHRAWQTQTNPILISYKCCPLLTFKDANFFCELGMLGNPTCLLHCKSAAWPLHYGYKFLGEHPSLPELKTAQSLDQCHRSTCMEHVNELWLYSLEM